MANIATRGTTTRRSCTCPASRNRDVDITVRGASLSRFTSRTPAMRRRCCAPGAPPRRPPQGQHTLAADRSHPEPALRHSTGMNHPSRDRWDVG